MGFNDSNTATGTFTDLGVPRAEDEGGQIERWKGYVVYAALIVVWTLRSLSSSS